MVNKEPFIIEFNDQQIEVAQYLSIEKKLDLISDIINSSLDDNTYYNPCRIEIFMLTKIIEAYTGLRAEHLKAPADRDPVHLHNPLSGWGNGHSRKKRGGYAASWSPECRIL